MVVVQTCCGCGTLRTGGLIIGYLGFISGMIVMLFPSPYTSTFAITMKIYGAITAVLAALMIYGITKNKRGLLMPYLAYLVLGVLYFVLLVIFPPPMPAIEHGRLVVYESSHANYVLPAALQIYFVLVVYSLYKQMESGLPVVHPNGAPVIATVQHVQPGYGQPAYGQTVYPGQPAQPVYGQPLLPQQPAYGQPGLPQQPVHGSNPPPYTTDLAENKDAVYPTAPLDSMK